MTREKDGKEYAEIWKRFVASVIDALMVSVFNGFVLLRVLRYLSMGQYYGLVSVLFILLYYTFFIGRYGQTIAGRWLRIKVVDVQSNLPPSYFKAFLRDALSTVPALFATRYFSILLFIVIDHIWVIWDSRRQTIHDKIAATIVIRSS